MTKVKMHMANALDLDPDRPSLLLALVNEVTEHERCILTLNWVRFRGDPEINRPILPAAHSLSVITYPG